MFMLDGGISFDRESGVWEVIGVVEVQEVFRIVLSLGQCGAIPTELLKEHYLI